MDYSKITLGELLSSPNEIIKRNAGSQLKQFQKCPHNEGINWENKIKCLKCGLTSKEFIRYKTI